MPRVSINFQNTIIYKIEHTDKPELFYIGNTTDFTKKKNLHKTASLKEPKGMYKSLHQMICENNGFDSFKMTEIKKFPCLDKNEADAEAWRLTVEIKQELLKQECIANENKIKDGKFIPKLSYGCSLITCNFGSIMMPDSKNRHVGTKRHLKYEATIKINDTAN